MIYRVIIIVCILLCGCSSVPSDVKDSVRVLNTIAPKIIFYAVKGAQLTAPKTEIQKEIQIINQWWQTFQLLKERCER